MFNILCLIDKTIYFDNNHFLWDAAGPAGCAGLRKKYNCAGGARRGAECAAAVLMVITADQNADQLLPAETKSGTRQSKVSNL